VKPQLILHCRRCQETNNPLSPGFSSPSHQPIYTMRSRRNCETTLIFERIGIPPAHPQNCMIFERMRRAPQLFTSSPRASVSCPAATSLSDVRHNPTSSIQTSIPRSAPHPKKKSRAQTYWVVETTMCHSGAQRRVLLPGALDCLPQSGGAVAATGALK
jgi:hypothetical protein